MARRTAGHQDAYVAMEIARLRARHVADKERPKLPKSSASAPNWVRDAPADPEKALAAEIHAAPHRMFRPQISTKLKPLSVPTEIDVERIHEAANAAIRSCVGHRAFSRRDERRMVGLREAQRAPQKAFATLGKLARPRERLLNERLPGRRTLTAARRSPAKRARSLPEPEPEPELKQRGSHSPRLRKGDEVGSSDFNGVVQAVWSSRRTQTVRNGEVVEAKPRHEVLVRFESGAEWFPEHRLRLLRRPTKSELQSTLADLDPDLSSTLGRSLWTACAAQHLGGTRSLKLD